MDYQSESGFDIESICNSSVMQSDSKKQNIFHMYNQTALSSTNGMGGSPGRRQAIAQGKYGRQRKESLNLMRDSNALEGSTLFELLNHGGGFDDSWKFDDECSKTPAPRNSGKFSDKYEGHSTVMGGLHSEHNSTFGTIAFDAEAKDILAEIELSSSSRQSKRND